MDEDDGEYDPDEITYSENKDSFQIPIQVLKRLPRPRFGSVAYGQVIKSCAVPGTIALTFDDGPWTYTSDLLDLLDKEDVQATFFVTGGNLDSDQILGHGNGVNLRRMLNSGHQVGSHTWGHPDLATLDEEQVYQHMLRNEQAIFSVVGLVPTYFRSPYLSTGGVTINVANELGYHVIDTDLDTRDWAGDYDAAKDNFSGGINASDPNTSSHLVLAHDIHEQTVHEFAQFMIDEGKEAGYRFVTVGECLGDPIRNWYRNPYNGEALVPRKRGAQAAAGPSVDSGVTKSIRINARRQDVTAGSDQENVKDNSVAARSARLKPSTTIEIDFPFSEGQRPPTGFHMEPEIIAKRDDNDFDRGDPLDKKYPDKTSTIASEVATGRPVQSFPTTDRYMDKPTNNEVETTETQQEEEEEKATSGGTSPFTPAPGRFSRFLWSLRNQTDGNPYSGGLISKAPSTLAFIIGVAVMIACLTKMT